MTVIDPETKKKVAYITIGYRTDCGYNYEFPTHFECYDLRNWPDYNYIDARRWCINQTSKLHPNAVQCRVKSVEYEP